MRTCSFLALWRRLSSDGGAHQRNTADVFWPMGADGADVVFTETQNTAPATPAGVRPKNWPDPVGAWKIYN